MTLRTLNYGNYGIFLVMQDFVHQPFEGLLYYKGTIGFPLKGSIKCLEFPKIRGILFWGPYNKDPTILGVLY